MYEGENKERSEQKSGASWLRRLHFRNLNTGSWAHPGKFPAANCAIKSANPGNFKIIIICLFKSNTLSFRNLKNYLTDKTTKSE